MQDKGSEPLGWFSRSKLRNWMSAYKRSGTKSVAMYIPSSLSDKALCTTQTRSPTFHQRMYRCDHMALNDCHCESLSLTFPKPLAQAMLYDLSGIETNRGGRNLLGEIVFLFFFFMTLLYMC